jgi:hypothetical protein
MTHHQSMVEHVVPSQRTVGDAPITEDERGAVEALGNLLLRHTVVLVRTDGVSGRGTGFVVPWRGESRVVTARHVIREGKWAVETVPPGRSEALKES